MLINQTFEKLHSMRLTGLVNDSGYIALSCVSWGGSSNPGIRAVRVVQ